MKWLCDEGTGEWNEHTGIFLGTVSERSTREGDLLLYTAPELSLIHIYNRGRFDFGMMSVDYSVGAHWHKAIELMYIVEGDVLVSVDEEKHVMKTGEIVICSSRQIHYFTSLCESSKMSFVIFDEDILDKLDLTGDFSINFLSKSKMLELGMTCLLYTSRCV